MNYIITFLISMIPLVELRGAVPFAIANGIPLWEALAIGVVGNMLPVPIIFFFARKVLEWGADKPYTGKLFVGIPLPGTGAWTGTLAASLLDWEFKHSVIAVILGVILAGCIMGTLSIIGFNLF